MGLIVCFASTSRHAYNVHMATPHTPTYHHYIIVVWCVRVVDATTRAECARSMCLGASSAAVDMYWMPIAHAYTVPHMVESMVSAHWVCTWVPIESV